MKQINEKQILKIMLISKRPHTSMIITGLIKFADTHNIKWKIIDYTKNSDFSFHTVPLVMVDYCNQKIMFDVEDGYWNQKGMIGILEKVDFYFKRSYSEDKNSYFPKHLRDKIHPLGFNYYVTCKECPIALRPHNYKYYIKRLLGEKSDKYYTTTFFEGSANYKKENITIAFFTRLWEPNLTEDENSDKTCEYLNTEREEINQMRIQLIKSLKQKYGNRFIGGVSDTTYARKICPDLIMSNQYTRKDTYLKMIKNIDICIASTGLHQSIGWKTGEYVAAARAIISEKFYYSVPGEFTVGKNYFEFSTVDECLEGVEKLIKNQDLLYKMKQANEEYYKKYLEPKQMISNAFARIHLL